VSARVLAVGGVSGVHDALLCAALRARGIAAEPIAVPDGRALATGRALLARGHCNPTYYLSGALVEHLRAFAAREGLAPAEVGARRAHLTAGSCGPCRFATYAAEHRRALVAAGFTGVAVATLEQTAPGPTSALAALGVRVDARLVVALARAVVLGDLLVQAGCERRPAAANPGAVDEALGRAGHALEAALVAGAPLGPPLAALRAELDALPRRARQAPPLAVRVTGEFFAATTDGEGGHRLIRWLEARDARVTPPPVSEWLLYLAWQAGTPRARRAGAALRALHRRLALVAGVTASLADLDDLAALAAPHYHTALRGGAGHLEVATFLAADRDASADLVVSVKPFGCLPSSAVSDGIVPALARRARRAVFVAVETTGDAEAAVESRLELALDLAAARRARGPDRPDQSETTQAAPGSSRATRVPSPS
jgi:predicted nucleotide-binding protein (sugar kinase/HSP70/actin superfamily)